MNRLLFFLASLLYCLSTYSQEVKLFTGTDFPLQHYVGINYQHNDRFSADLSFGLVTSPYNNELYDWINVPSRLESRKDFIQDFTNDGSVLGLGLNVHKNKWYIGIQGQHIQLNGSSSYNEIINSDFVQNDLAPGEKQLLDSVLNILRSPIGRLLVDLEDQVSIETNLIQLGLKVGRQIQFKDSKFSMNVELGITANIQATTKTTYDQALASQIEVFAQNFVTGSNSNQLIENLDFEQQGELVNEFFEDYGFIPSLRVGVVYRLWKK